MTGSGDDAPRGGKFDAASGLRVFLIAEVRDFTPFSQERGDEAAARLVQRFASLARQVIQSFDGEVIELRGDEALAVFESARRALRAAVELRSRFIEETERDPSLPLRVGIGLDAGEAVPFEAGYRGRAINLAARLKDQARAGQVLATEALIHLAGQTEGLAYLDRGLVHPKGFALPVRVVEVVIEGQTAPRDESIDDPDLLTFLWSDIRAYYGVTSSLSDAARVKLETWYVGLVEECIRASGGRVLEVAGDEALAAFVSPRQAIRTALDLQERFRRELELEFKLPLSLGIGIEAGEAIPVRGKYSGRVIFLASRICALAGEGDVLLGETAARLTGGLEGVRLIDKGEVRIAQDAQPVRVMRVVLEDDSAIHVSS